MIKRRQTQSVNGILLLDKAVGKTSNQALTEVKHLFEAKKAGHTGSLDPLAYGMLPICFGEATKYSQFLLEADKQYKVQAKLGVRTTTGDAEGEIIKTVPVKVDNATLEKALNAFRGKINQIPSMYSALKFQGKPLYSYARQGIEIERASRTVFIKHLSLENYEEPNFELIVTCSKGTYIRTLIEDIGESLGCGAYVTSLCRLYVEPYQNAHMYKIEELIKLKEKNSLAETALLSLQSAIESFPALTLCASSAFYVKQGQAVLVAHAPTAGYVRLFADDQNFLGVGHVLEDGRIAPKRLQRTV